MISVSEKSCKNRLVFEQQQKKKQLLPAREISPVENGKLYILPWYIIKEYLLDTQGISSRKILHGRNVQHPIVL